MAEVHALEDFVTRARFEDLSREARVQATRRIAES